MAYCQRLGLPSGVDGHILDKVLELQLENSKYSFCFTTRPIRKLHMHGTDNKKHATIKALVGCRPFADAFVWKPLKHLLTKSPFAKNPTDTSCDHNV